MKCYLLFLLLVMWPLTINAETKEVEWFNKPVSIIAQAEPLESVLSKISAITGVTIVFDQGQKNRRVSMAYDDIPLHQVLNRIFSHQNKSFIFNNEEEIIIVRSFEAKEYVWTADDRGQVTLPLKMTAEEIDQLHKNQYQEYLADQSNDDQVLENGMTRSELVALHELQYQEYLDSKEDGNSLLENGITRDQLNTMHAQQYEEYTSEIEDDSMILDDGIMTRKELRAMHESQYKSYQNSLTDNSNLLESMSKNELHEMHLQQYEEYKNSLNYETY